MRAMLLRGLVGILYLATSWAVKLHIDQNNYGDAAYSIAAGLLLLGVFFELAMQPTQISVNLKPKDPDERRD